MPTWTCPECTTALTRTPGGRWRCSDCALEFPVHGRVPFLHPKPNQALGQWRNRINAELAELESQAAMAAQALGNMHADAPATTRLDQMRKGCQAQLKALDPLCAPLSVGTALARETHLALGTHIERHHGALSYQSNILRDWCWGEVETKAAIAQLNHLLEATDEPIKRVLVVGGGAGRLAYDIDQNIALEEIVCLDFNPLLCQLGSQVLAGENLDFVEFPLAPRSAEDIAVTQKLQRPGPTSDRIHFVCANAQHLPIPASSVDLVVSPWLLDVIDAPAPQMLTIFNDALRDRGLWIYQGSVAFDSVDPQYRYCAEEIHSQAQATGFDVLRHDDSLTPYLQSPHSRQQRSEWIHGFIARKRESIEVMNSVPTVPAWLEKTDLPIPLSDAFKTQILSVRVHAFVMSHIDGKRTINDIADILEQQRLMPKAQAREAIRGMLEKMLAEKRAGSAHQERAG